jgi:hypothetical protein
MKSNGYLSQARTKIALALEFPTLVIAFLSKDLLFQVRHYHVLQHPGLRRPIAALGGERRRPTSYGLTGCTGGHQGHTGSLCEVD